METNGTPSPEIMEEWTKWLSARPPNVQAVAERLVPWKLYRMKPNGERVIVIAYGTDADDKVSVRVFISGKYNLVMFEREVFGVDPNDLEPCELPGPDEKVGVVLTEEEHINAYCKALMENYREQSEHLDCMQRQPGAEPACGGDTCQDVQPGPNP